MTTIVIPLHHGGGKLKDDSELRFALRSIAANFSGPVEVAIIGKKLPHWVKGVRFIEQRQKGLKAALHMAARAYPSGFFWFYDDCCILKPITSEEMKVTPCSRGWSKPHTSWARKLDSIRVRLEADGKKAWDYSRPHGPYWFDLGMIEEAFRDWPGMEGKLPVESWILSKRDWPRRHSGYKQYYGAYKGPPGEQQQFLNYNNAGFTEELRAWLSEKFPDLCRFEKPPVVISPDTRLRGVVIGLPARPRWESACVETMAAVGIDLDQVAGFDGHSGIAPPMQVNTAAFKKDFKREPLPGEIGCFASHYNIARSAGDLPPLSDQLPHWRLVFEDDAIPNGIDAPKLLEIAALADEQGFDVVMLHTGRRNRRGVGPTNVSRTNGTDVFTHAVLFNLRAGKEISGWEMRHPIDHAISRAKKLKVGVLWGPARFDQRPPGESSVSIHRERKASYAGRTFFLPSKDAPVPSGTVKKIHQVWIQGEEAMPEAFKANRGLWQAEFPDFELVLWDEKSARAQWPEFAAVSSKCYHHATRADLILARALRDFGGLATGTDCRPNHPGKLRAIMEATDAFLVLTPGRPEVSNGLQWCAKPNHPFWKCVCNHQLRERGKHLPRKSVSAATGPRCYHEAFHAHMWDLHVITAPAAFTRDWKGGWTNPTALIDPGFAASWTK
jgi:hypothetical protein